LGSCFMIRCTRMGNPTRAAPTRRIECIPALYRDGSGSFEIPLLAVLRTAVGGERSRLHRNDLAHELPTFEDAQMQAEQNRGGEMTGGIEQELGHDWHGGEPVDS